MRSPLTLIPLLFLGGFIAIIAAIAAIIITESTKKKKQNELRLKMLMANDTKPSQNDETAFNFIGWKFIPILLSRAVWKRCHK